VVDTMRDITRSFPRNSCSTFTLLSRIMHPRTTLSEISLVYSASASRFALNQSSTPFFSVFLAIFSTVTPPPPRR
jgi:hypothetical protein